MSLELLQPCAWHFTVFMHMSVFCTSPCMYVFLFITAALFLLYVSKLFKLDLCQEPWFHFNAYKALVWFSVGHFLYLTDPHLFYQLLCARKQYSLLLERILCESLAETAASERKWLLGMPDTRLVRPAWSDAFNQRKLLILTSAGIKPCDPQVTGQSATSGFLKEKLLSVFQPRRACISLNQQK